MHYLKKIYTCVFLLIASTLISCHVVADVIDPVKYIQENGYQWITIGDDGKTRFYNYHKVTTPTHIASLEREVSLLPKATELLPVCDLMRGGAKAVVIKKYGIAVDVAVVDYGYSGSIIVCVLKWMHEAKVATQIFYGNSGPQGTYNVFVTD